MFSDNDVCSVLNVDGDDVQLHMFMTRLCNLLLSLQMFFGRVLLKHHA
jgi:hypothetical protein